MGFNSQLTLSLLLAPIVENLSQSLDAKQPTNVHKNRVHVDENF